MLQMVKAHIICACTQTHTIYIHNINCTNACNSSGDRISYGTP